MADIRPDTNPEEPIDSSERRVSCPACGSPYVVQGVQSSREESVSFTCSAGDCGHTGQIDIED